MTQWNADGRKQGHTDTPLNDTGREMAARLAQRMAREPIDALYSSDLRRALETVRPLLEYHNLHINADPRLREGRWANQEWESEYPVLPFSVDSETRENLFERMRDAMTEIARNHDGQTVLVMSHGGATRSFIEWILRNSGNDPSTYLRHKTALNLIEHDQGAWRVVMMNDISFFEGLTGSLNTAIDGRGT